MSAALLIRTVPPTEFNGLPWKPYTYRGTGEDILTPFLDSVPEPPPPPAEPCWCGGDMRGYRKHLRLPPTDPRSETCQESRDDVNLHARSRTWRKPLKAHLRASDGQPRCGSRGTLMVTSRDQVTCKGCLAFSARRPA